MMQYANRYRHTHENIRAALDKSMYLFSTEFRYQDALDEIERHWKLLSQGVQTNRRFLF